MATQRPSTSSLTFSSAVRPELRVTTSSMPVGRTSRRSFSAAARTDSATATALVPFCLEIASVTAVRAGASAADGGEPLG